MYEVIKDFADLQDDKHLYHAGDEFPRSGVKATASRIKELSTNNNLMGSPLIKEVVVEKESTKTTKRRKTDDAD